MICSHRFGDIFGSAHAGMTAEGDNSVLMQKVTKEHMSLFKPHAVSRPSKLDFMDAKHIEYLFMVRENDQHSYLRNKIGKAMLFTKVSKWQ